LTAPKVEGGGPGRRKARGKEILKYGSKATSWKGDHPDCGEGSRHSLEYSEKEEGWSLPSILLMVVIRPKRCLRKGGAGEGEQASHVIETEPN